MEWLEQWQDMNYGGRHSARVHTQSALPDFVKLAEAYGRVGIRAWKKRQTFKVVWKKPLP